MSSIAEALEKAATKSGEASVSSDSDDELVSSEEVDAAGELMAALKGDAKTFAMALRNFNSLKRK